ncbi:hypothetical protein BGZ58_001389 [Dissophora ornata]|nr:hypothetical protein BGZ58_001389 [Dissophora ornata]
MRLVIILLCVINVVFTDRWYNIAVNEAPESTGLDIYAAVRNRFEAIFTTFRSAVTVNPRQGFTRTSLVAGPSGREMLVDLIWQPGMDVGEFGSGIRPPIPPTAGDLNALVTEYRQIIFEQGDDRLCLEITDNCRRGGRLTVNVVDFGQDLKKRAKAPKFNVTMVPYGDGMNGTFIDMTKNTKHKIPPANFLNIPTKVGPSDSTICPRGDINWNPMSTCLGYPNTLISGKSISSNGSPTQVTSGIGNIANFIDGSFCTTVLAGVDRYTCWGETSTPGPYQAHLETNGNLCLCDANGINYACTGPTGPNDGQYRMVMQDDGNLVIYRGRDFTQPIWASRTNWNPNMPKNYRLPDCNIPNM